MKYWEGKTGTKKEGQFGSMDDNGSVPATKADYDARVAAQPAPPAPKDFKDLLSKALTPADKIQVIADKLGLL
jgi:hypothetical protein